MQHDQTGGPCVERGGGVGVGVIVKEPIEEREGLEFGLAGLPRGGRDGDGGADGVAAAEADVEMDWPVLARVTSSSSSGAIRLRSRCGVDGSDHRAGKSQASARMRALWSSSSAATDSAAVWLVLVRGSAVGGGRRSSQLRGCQPPTGCRGQRRGSGDGRVGRGGGPVRHGSGGAGRLRRRGLRGDSPSEQERSAVRPTSGVRLMECALCLGPPARQSHSSKPTNAGHAGSAFILLRSFIWC